jgi:hypothetical protein
MICGEKKVILRSSDMEFRQLELELLKSNDKKESKIGKFCKKYNYIQIQLDLLDMVLLLV